MYLIYDETGKSMFENTDEKKTHEKQHNQKTIYFLLINLIKIIRIFSCLKITNLARTQGEFLIFFLRSSLQLYCTGIQTELMRPLC